MKKLSISFIVLLSVTLFACNNGVKDSNAVNTKNTEKAAEHEVQIVSDMSKFNELIAGDTPVLVDFYADWCAPCRQMAPILEQFSKDMNGTVRVIKINVDQLLYCSKKERLPGRE
jgi:thioredoxin-like negative regulator of GroEL